MAKQSRIAQLGVTLCLFRQASRLAAAGLFMFRDLKEDEETDGPRPESWTGGLMEKRGNRGQVQLRRQHDQVSQATHGNGTICLLQLIAALSARSATM